VKPELDALDPANLVRVSYDLAKAATHAVAVIPRIMEHRDSIVRDLPSFDISNLDKLRDYADAMFFVAANTSTEPVDPAMQHMLDEATALRERMLGVAEGFVHVGLFDAARVAHIRAVTGYVDMSKDLSGLSEMYRLAWGKLEGRCPITIAEIERAGALSNLVRDAAGSKGLRAHLGERTATGADVDRRARVFTLFLQAYDECRSAIAYIRRKEGDAESIAPTVFLRAPRRASRDEPDEIETLVPGGAAVQPAPAVVPAPAPATTNGGPTP
jgi:hypothetical protein